MAQRHSQAKDNAVCVRVGGRGECVVCGLCERGANELRVCVYVSGVGMCVCAVCRWGVCAGMPVVRRVRLWLWVWRVGGGVRRGETARQRTRQCVCVVEGEVRER